MMQLISFFGFVLVVLACHTQENAGEPNGQCSLRFPPHRDGYCLRISSCPGAVLRSLCPQHASHMGCCILEHSPSPHDNVASNISLRMFTDIFNATIRSKMLFNYLPRSLHIAKVKSCHQQSAFLTQIAYDTNFLSTMEEVRKNIQTATKEHLKFIGRGAIHFSGKKFYEWLENELHLRIVDQPESLTFPSKAFLSASTAWANSYSLVQNGPLHHVTYNNLADGSEYGFLLLSYYLRGNLNGIDRLLDIWKKVNKALNCQCSVDHGPYCEINGHRGRCKHVKDCKGKQVESFDQCHGPAAVVQCSLDFTENIDIQLYVQQDFATGTKAIQSIIQILKRITANNNSGLTMSNFSKRDSYGKRFLTRQRKTNEELFKREVTLVIGDMQLTNKDLQALTERNAFNTVMLKHDMNSTKMIGNNLLLNYSFTIKESNLESGLIENVLEGPWSLESSSGVKFQLQKSEKIYLTVPVDDDDLTSMPMISIDRLRGDVRIDGVKKLAEISPDNKPHCYLTPNTKPGTVHYRSIMIKYISNNQTRSFKVIKTIELNSKVVVTAQGIKNDNLFTLEVSRFTKATEMSSKQEKTASLIAIISNLSIVVSCLMTILFLYAIINRRPCYKLCQKTICKYAAQLEPTPELGIEEQRHFPTTLHIEGSSRESNEHSHYVASPLCTCRSRHSINGRNEICERMDNIAKRSLIAFSYIRSFKVFCILLYNISVIIGNFTTASKPVVTMSLFMSRYSSTVLYIWFVVEIALGFGNDTPLLRLLRHNSNKKDLFYVLVWGIPVILSLFQFIPVVSSHGPKWLKIDALADLSCKGNLFLVTLFLWIRCIIKQIRDKDTCIAWLQTLAVLLLNLQFSLTWILNSFKADLRSNYWFDYCYVTAHFTLAVSIYVSTHYQTKEGIVKLKERRESDDIIRTEDRTPTIWRQNDNLADPAHV
eukprot:Seg1011.2 transcript_id=Seg1011.2/GoldUCD/mRNA.D3Y31 product="hypothetical protein" protein_id=Seg1011.2/GoldUCD/D3Y31